MKTATTDEEKRIAIAEAVDPIQYPPGTGQVIRGEPIWVGRNKVGNYVITCPDFLNSLDVMHEALQTLTTVGQREDFADNLLFLADEGRGYSIYTAGWQGASASARELADAFLETIKR